MSNNCFLTKLNGVVNNPNLPFFNSITLNFIKASGTPVDSALTFRITGSAVVKTDSAHVFYVDGASTGVREYILNSNSYVSFKGQNDDYKVVITPKNGIVSFNSDAQQKNYVFDVNDMDMVSELLFINNIRTLSGQKLNSCSAITIDASYTEIVVDMNTFKYNAIKSWGGIMLAYCNLVGAFSANSSIISAFAGSNNNNVMLDLHNTSVFGSIEDFAAAIVSAGKTTGTIKMNMDSTPNVTKPSGISTYDKILITFNSSLPNGYSISNFT